MQYSSVLVANLVNGLTQWGIFCLSLNLLLPMYMYKINIEKENGLEQMTKLVRCGIFSLMSTDGSQVIESLGI